jgi:hypothetical protein
MSVTINGTTGITTPKLNIVDALPSIVSLNTANGYGSTNTVIRRFTNTVINQGIDISYTDSATLGASFLINTSGIYSISYTESLSVSNTFGLSDDSTQLTTSIQSITSANILNYAQTPGANISSNLAWTGYLASGSVVRPHGSGQASGSQLQVFIITRIS